MKKIITAISLITAALVSTTTYAMSAAQLVEDLNQVLNSDSPSPWLSLPKSNLRFIVVDASTNQGTAVGYSRAELESSGIKFESGKNGFTFPGLNFPKINFFTACDFMSCGENQTWSDDDRQHIAPIVTLLHSSQHPVLIVSSQLSGDWVKVPELTGVTEEQVLLITALHEIFHSYQSLISQHPDGSPRPDFTQCFGSNDSHVDPLIVTDMKNWNGVLKNIFFEPSSFNSSLQRALNLNGLKSDNCLRTGWFLSESVPQYFSLGLISAAGVFTDEQIYHYYSSLWLTNPDNSSLNYGIGLVMLRSLARLDPQLNWQKNLEEGESIDDVFHRYLNR